MCPIMSMKRRQVMCEFKSGAPEVHNSRLQCSVKFMHRFCLAQVIALRQFGTTSVAQWMRELVQGFQVPVAWSVTWQAPLAVLSVCLSDRIPLVRTNHCQAPSLAVAAQEDGHGMVPESSCQASLPRQRWRCQQGAANYWPSVWICRQNCSRTLKLPDHL